MNKCIVITTLSNNLNTIRQIQEKLLKDHLAAGCQITKTKSSYWWDDKINESEEYCLTIRTIEPLYNKIEQTIKNIHNYKVPEISYYEIKGSSDIIEWINKNINASNC